MITERQRQIVRDVWPDGDIPSDERIERAHAKWIEEAKESMNAGYCGDFYFDFGLALQTYAPACWLDLFTE